MTLARGDGCLEDLAEQGALPGQRRAATLPGHLGYGAAEVEVDVGHPVLGAQDLGRLADVRRVGAVELDRADRLAVVEDQHLPRAGVALDQPAAGDHLADVQTRALLGAEPTVGSVGDAGHRRQDDRSVDLQRAEPQWSMGSGGQEDAFFSGFFVWAGLTTRPFQTIGASAITGR